MNSNNSINQIQNDEIDSALIRIEALQKEYEVTLQLYQEAGKNYITALQNAPSNPCKDYEKDSTGISQECYEKIWKDQGCLTEIPAAAEGDWAKAQTLDGLVNDSFLWATMTDDEHRKGCYGDSTDYTTNTEAVYPNDSTSANSKFVALKGRTWWGVSGLSEASVSTQEECENMCAETSECSGATFNPVKRYCWIRTGESAITPGLPDDYALITQQKATLSVMKYLNQKLLDLNKEITNEIGTINPQFEAENKDKNTKQQQLSLSYKQLLEQKIAMDKQLKEYYSITQEEENQGLFVNQQNVSYKFWVLITCLVLLITITKFFGGDNPPLPMTAWLLIIIVLIILTFTLSSRSGFMMWFILIVAIVLFKSKSLQSE